MAPIACANLPRVRHLPLLLLLLLSTSACGGPAPASSPAPDPAPTDPIAAAPFRCDLPLGLEDAGTPAHLADVNVAVHDGFDRITFAFAHGLPAVELRQVTPPFFTDGAGDPLPVEGRFFLGLVMHGATRGGHDGPMTYRGPTDFAPRSTQLLQLRMSGDLEMTMGWLIGLAEPPCYRVFVFDEPRRLVLDLAGRG